MQLRNILTSFLSFVNPARILQSDAIPKSVQVMHLDVFESIGIITAFSCIGTAANAAHTIGVRNGLYTSLKRDMRNLYRENDRLKQEIAVLRNNTELTRERIDHDLLEIEKRNTLYLHLLYRITESRNNVSEEFRTMIDGIDEF